MSTDSPFFFARVECPICKTVNEFETIKVGSYTEASRDTDFCPQEIKWRHPRYQGYDPLVFFSATCLNCFYTREFNNSYKEWKNDNNFRTYRLKSVKEKHLDQLAQADSVIRQLGTAIDVPRYPSESAILKLHLAVYDELLADRVIPLDVGRLYLRIGWVFRNMGSSENPNLAFLKGLLREIDGKFHQLRDSKETFQKELATFERHVMAHYETSELSSDIKSQMLPFREKFQNEIAAGSQAIDGCSDRLGSIENLISEYKSAILGADDLDNGGSFGQSPSFASFLMGVKKQWNGAATNEAEALERAVRYYKEAFESGSGIAAGNQQIQASYLIAELSRRIGDYDEAKQFFNSTIKHGQEYIYKHRNDQSKTALARKILELALEQNRSIMASTRKS